MNKKGRRFSIGKKMYLMVTLIVMLTIIGTVTLSFVISVRRIDSYYKRLSINIAKSYVAYVDADYMKELKEYVASEEFQKIRVEAEEKEDDSLVENALKEQGLWDKFIEQRDLQRKFIENMQDVKYLYCIVWNENEEEGDMYLVDSDDVPLSELGYFEPREKEFEGTNADKTIQPVISEGDWGWLCSSYAPIYDSDGDVICHVGCDIDMEDVMHDRSIYMTAIALASAAYMIIVLVIAIRLVKKSVVNPLTDITKAMGKFSPGAGKDYISAGVINLDIKSGDEIGDIYNEIRSMQQNIIDYSNDISNFRRDMEQAEKNLELRDKELGRLSAEALKDPLTGIGNKIAYTKKLDELNRAIKEGKAEFAVVMVDANGLKVTNDRYGHTAGDTFIKGCCHLMCEAFKHSPVYRVGGDEFVAVLGGEDYVDRYIKVRELRDTYKHCSHDMNVEPWLRFSAAVGLSVYSKEDKDAEQVFRRADKEMYEEKQVIKKHLAEGK